jgi:asparagine synthase (glutamine-hydrolysing)
VDLAAWAARHGLELVCEDGPFRLWRRPLGQGRVLIDADSCACFVGTSFPPTQDPARRVLRTCRNQGAAALTGIDGQFRLILWERRLHELILYRDGSGAHNLYYHQHPAGGLVFADDLDLLAASPAVAKALARPSLHEYLRLLDVSPPNTIYAGVFATEPGAPCIYGPRGLYRGEFKATQAQGAAGRTHAPETLEAAAEALDRRLDAAVAARLDPAGTNIAFLSGGVDSALVCALAAARARGRVTALTVGFEGADFDESGIAQAVAQHLGVPHRVLRFSMSDYRRAFDELAAGTEFPFGDPAALPSLLAYRAARELAEVALDGTGADTLLGIMPARHQRLAIAYGTLIPRPLRRRLAVVMAEVPSLRPYIPLVGFDDPQELLMRWPGWTRQELEGLCREQVSLGHTRFYRVYAGFPRGAHWQRYSALLGNLPDDRVHQASRLTGLQVRFPFFDAGVRSLVESLDQRLRFQPGEPKRVLKEVLARRVPRSLWQVPKHGFDFPFADLLAAQRFALVREYLDPSRMAAWDLVALEPVRQVTSAFLTGDRRVAFRVWALVVLFAWLEGHYRRL